MTTNELNYRHLLKLFYDKKCLTLEALAEPLDYSIRSVQRLLKKTGYYSSFTHNSKWYVLQTTPSFNEMGLWFYKNIGFSKHGNLSQTIFYFINKSHQGLTAKEISEIISVPCHPVLNMMYKKNKIDRLSTKGGFTYVSKEEQKKERQASLVLQVDKSYLPSDADAVSILVELIKKPGYTPDELYSSLAGRITCKPKSVILLLQYHKLEKKTLDM